jgi:hypothetical protein
MGAAMRAEDKARNLVVRQPAVPATTSRLSLSSPAAIQRRMSPADDERSEAAVPAPIARSRIPTVRRSRGIDEPDTEGSNRRNLSGETLNVTPAMSRTAAMAVPIVVARGFMQIKNKSGPGPGRIQNTMAARALGSRKRHCGGNSGKISSALAT